MDQGGTDGFNVEGDEDKDEETAPATVKGEPTSKARAKPAEKGKAKGSSFYERPAKEDAAVSQNEPSQAERRIVLKENVNVYADACMNCSASTVQGQVECDVCGTILIKDVKKLSQKKVLLFHRGEKLEALGFDPKISAETVKSMRNSMDFKEAPLTGSRAT